MFYVYPLFVDTLIYLHCPTTIDNTMINIPLDLYDAFFGIYIQECDFWILGHLCTYLMERLPGCVPTGCDGLHPCRQFKSFQVLIAPPD